jgi:ATP-dependent Clp protease ATP-binding subunit ClpA
VPGLGALVAASIVAIRSPLEGHHEGNQQAETSSCSSMSCTLVGLGPPRLGGCLNMLKRVVAGEVQVIGATTLDEYRRYIEKNGALERRFQPIIVQPPTVRSDRYSARPQERYETIIGENPDDASSGVKLADRYVARSTR